MINEVDFESLARKANESGGAMEDLNMIFAAAYAIEKWFFIGRGEIPNISPDGTTQFIDMPTNETIEYLERFIKHDVYGVWFNSDTESDGFSIIIYIFFGGASLLLLFDSIKPSGVRSGGIFVASFSLLPALAIFYLASNGKRKSIKSYDASGITRNDGQHFLWSDFLGVISRIGNNLFGAKAAGAPNWYLQTSASLGLFRSGLKITRKLMVLLMPCRKRF